MLYQAEVEVHEEVRARAQAILRQLIASYPSSIKIKNV